MTIERIRSTAETNMNTTIENIRITLQRTINDVMTELTTQLSSAFNSIATEISEALNKSIDKLWEMNGLMRGILLSPVPVRNITPIGFEVYSVGNITIHWVAYTTPDPKLIESIQKAAEIGEKIVEYEETVKNLIEWVKTLKETLKTKGIPIPVIPELKI